MELMFLRYVGLMFLLYVGLMFLLYVELNVSPVCEDGVPVVW
jgi:hypothetical protein